MDAPAGILWRKALIEDARLELKKGKHLLLTGPIGIGKSAVLAQALAAQPARRTIFRLYNTQTRRLIGRDVSGISFCFRPRAEVQGCYLRHLR